MSLGGGRTHNSRALSGAHGAIFAHSRFGVVFTTSRTITPAQTPLRGDGSSTLLKHFGGGHHHQLQWPKASAVLSTSSEGGHPTNSNGPRPVVLSQHSSPSGASDDDDRSTHPGPGYPVSRRCLKCPVQSFLIFSSFRVLSSASMPSVSAVCGGRRRALSCPLGLTWYLSPYHLRTSCNLTAFSLLPAVSNPLPSWSLDGTRLDIGSHVVRDVLASSLLVPGYGIALSG